jgi:hypothetical protein
MGYNLFMAEERLIYFGGVSACQRRYVYRLCELIWRELSGISFD